MSSKSVEVKREQIEQAIGQMAGTTFVLDDDEDDREWPSLSGLVPFAHADMHQCPAEPLMIVLARRRKALAEDAKAAKMQKQKPRAKRVAKTKEKEKAVKVKTECVEEQMQNGTVLCSAYNPSSFLLTRPTHAP